MAEMILYYMSGWVLSFTIIGYFLEEFEKYISPVIAFYVVVLMVFLWPLTFLATTCYALAKFGQFFREQLRK